MHTNLTKNIKSDIYGMDMITNLLYFAPKGCPILPIVKSDTDDDTLLNDFSINMFSKCYENSVVVVNYSASDLLKHFNMKTINGFLEVAELFSKDDVLVECDNSVGDFSYLDNTFTYIKNTAKYTALIDNYSTWESKIMFSTTDNIDRVIRNLDLLENYNAIDGLTIAIELKEFEGKLVVNAIYDLLNHCAIIQYNPTTNAYDIVGKLDINAIRVIYRNLSFGDKIEFVSWFIKYLADGYSNDERCTIKNELGIINLA